MISQSEAVISIFGYWPEFADAKIVLLAFEVSGSIRLDLSYIDAGKQKAAVVSLRFTGVRELDLSKLLSENVLDELTISEGCPMRVELDPCYGLGGSFTCTGIEVTRVALNNSFKPSGLRPSA
jgi:hypothetical protein